MAKHHNALLFQLLWLKQDAAISTDLCSHGPLVLPKQGFDQIELNHQIQINNRHNMVNYEN